MSTTASKRIVPKALPFDDDAQLAPDAWGFRDTAFKLLPNGSVTLSGSRYALSGLELPSLLPWVSDIMRVDFKSMSLNKSSYPPKVPESRASGEFLAALGKIFAPASLTTDALVRLRHGHGHTVEEIYALRTNGLSRVPDVVVFPENTEQVQALVAFALEHNAAIVAFGGGTNVTDALRCSDHESRVIISADMRRMNRILWIDPENRCACIQAGAVGRYLADALAEAWFHHWARTRQLRVLHAGRMDRNTRQRHEEKSLRQHRRAAARRDTS